MQAEAKRELARALVQTSERREASWNGTYYQLHWSDAAEQTEMDTDIRPLVLAMLQAGYCEFPEWADRILGKQEAV
jgi:hypothetical protein